ncbi:hypothetical protein GCM10025789_26240 [Tessaracoccus lubricantis]|uniref:Uncharacterized protein n=1 Tax=Tessaracoccus lubricantis TaxID=545543 RepID=A0ABP9FK49_9ACTN
MSTAAYDSLTQAHTKIRGLAFTAVRNDVIENFLVLTRLENLAQAALQPWIAAAIAADAAQLFGRITGRLSSIQGHHQWLGASRRSVSLLGEAAGQWSNVVAQQQQVVATVRANKGRISGGEWRSVARDAHLDTVSRKEQKELAFADSVGRIVEGCTMAQLVTKNLMTQAATSCNQALMQTSVARTAPSAHSPHARNWRMRKVNAALGQLDAFYARLEGGATWRGQAQKVARIFDENAETLQALHKLSGGPLRATAV